jgi:hypothetical protein
VPDALTMGKAGEAEQAAPRPAAATSSGGFSGCWYGSAVYAKCVFVLLLAVSGFLSALFLLLHLWASGAIPDDPGTLAGKAKVFAKKEKSSALSSH